MGSSEDGQATAQRSPRWQLLWLLLTVPSAAALAAYPFFISVINLCGISGCSGGGFGVSYGPIALSVGMDLLIGGLFFAAVAIPRWGRVRTRLIAGGLVWVLVSGALVSVQLAERYPSR